jgi:hypothetical protein
MAEATWLTAFRDITTSTNERTALSSLLGPAGVGNSAPLYEMNPKLAAAAAILVANFNSFALDWTARFSVGGTHMNFFIVKQLPVLPPGVYLERGPEGATYAEFIVPRVLELTYTAWDLAGFARDLGYDGPPFRWDAERRFLLRCELDAAFFHLYGLARDDVAYVMDAFPIVRRNDEAAHGEYRTKRVILELYDDMARALAGGPPYQTRLDPPPADPRVAHPRESARADG